VFIIFVKGKKIREEHMADPNRYYCLIRSQVEGIESGLKEYIPVKVEEEKKNNRKQGKDREKRQEKDIIN
jgi:hypothetical protein